MRPFLPLAEHDTHETGHVQLVPSVHSSAHPRGAQARRQGVGALLAVHFVHQGVVRVGSHVSGGLADTQPQRALLLDRPLRASYFSTVAMIGLFQVVVMLCDQPGVERSWCGEKAGMEGYGGSIDCSQCLERVAVESAVGWACKREVGEVNVVGSVMLGQPFCAVQLLDLLFKIWGGRNRVWKKGVCGVVRVFWLASL